MRPPAAWAAPPGTERLDVRLGFDGIVKVGAPVPLEVAVPPLDLAGPAELAVDAPALGPEAGRVVTTTAVPFRAVAGVPQLLRATVVVNDPRRPLVVRLSVGGREALRTTVAVSPEQAAGRLLLVLSDERAGLPSLGRLSGVAVASLAGQELPRRWQEYAAVDLVVIRDLDPGSLDADQRDALLTWAQLGGRLLIIERPGRSSPPWLRAILPAAPDQTRVVSLPAGVGPPGPLAVVALSARADARRVVAGGATVMAEAAAGQGRVTVSGIDPWQREFLEWSGRLRWWDDAIGAGAARGVDPAAVADTLPAGTPLPLLAHVQVGGAIVLYVGLVLAIRRRWATLAGAAWSALVAIAAIGAFALLAEATRARAAMVTQAMILEEASGARRARATAVGAVAVPYGGRYHVLVDRGMTVQPLAPSGDVRMEVSESGTVIEGGLRSGAPARPFVAVGAVPLAVSAALSPDGGRLLVDFGRLKVRRVEIRSGDRVYRVGDLPAGASVTPLHADGWIAAAPGDRAGEEFAQRLREAIFHGPPADAILGGANVATTPVLVGEVGGVPSAFALGGAAAPGRQLTVLVVPLERR